MRQKVSAFISNAFHSDLARSLQATCKFLVFSCRPRYRHLLKTSFSDEVVMRKTFCFTRNVLWSDRRSRPQKFLQNVPCFGILYIQLRNWICFALGQLMLRSVMLLRFSNSIFGFSGNMTMPGMYGTILVTSDMSGLSLKKVAIIWEVRNEIIAGWQSIRVRCMNKTFFTGIGRLWSLIIVVDYVKRVFSHEGLEVRGYRAQV